MTATCWDRDSVPQIMKVDAGEPSEETNRLFLATHVAQPLQLVTGRQWMDQVTGTPATLPDLVQRIADSPPDAKLNWVVGDPGTGKSHLVRWLWLSQPETPQARVVFIPRTDAISLRKVVGRIIGDEVGPEFETVREALDTAAEGHPTAESARRSLIFQLANEIVTDFEISEKDQFRGFIERGWTSGHLDVARDASAWLLDAQFLQRLLAPDGTAARITDTRLGKRTAAQRDEEDLVFCSDDLPLQPDNIDEAGGQAHRLHCLLQDSPEIQRYALDVLNYHLDRAVQQVFGVARGMVTDAALELRRRLKDREESLWLYFEDFAVLQGVQQELLDVFVDNAPDLCDLRVVAAITPGPLRQLPTMVWGRTNVVCDLNLRQDEAEGFRESLIGRYLNAVRWGAEGLQQFATGAEVRNRCEACPLKVKEDCHAGFGTVEVDGLGPVGLYPFNPESLRRAIEQKVGAEGVFIPRFVITNVLREFTLNHHTAIERGTFPSPDLSREFTPQDDRLGGAAEGLLRDKCANAGLDADAATRAIAFQQLWGSSRTSFDPHHEVVTHLLGLRFPEAYTDAKRSARIDGTEDAPFPESARPKTRVAPTPRLVREVRLWADQADRELPEDDRNELRKALFDHVMAALHLENGHYGPTAWSTRGGFEQTDLVIDGKRERAYNHPVEVERSPGVAAALEDLAWLLDDPSGRSAVAPARLHRAFDRCVDRLAAQVREGVLPSGKHEEEMLLALCQALVVSGAMAGLRMDDTTAEACVASVLSPIPPSDEISDMYQMRLLRVARGDEGRGRTATPNRESVRQLLLRHVAFTQNEGAPQAIDFERLKGPANAALKEWKMPSSESLPAPFKPYLAALEKSVNRDVPEAVSAAARWWEGVRRHLSGAQDAADLARRIGAAVVRARQTGLLSDPALTEPTRTVITVADRIERGEVPVDLGVAHAVGHAIAGVPAGDLKSSLEALHAYYQHLRPLNALGTLVSNGLAVLAGAEEQATHKLGRSAGNSGVAISPAEGVNKAMDAVVHLKGGLK